MAAQPSSLTSELTSGQPLSNFGFVIADWDAEQEEQKECIALYKKIRRNPVIALGLAMKKAPIINLHWRVKAQDEQRAEFFKENIKNHWTKLIRQVLNAWDFGFSTFEKVYEIRDNQYFMRKLKQLDPETITVNYGPKGEFLGVTQRITPYNTMEEVVLPAEKTFVYTNQEEWGNVRGTSVLSNVVDTWHQRQKVVNKILFEYMAKYAGRTIVVRAPIGKTKIEGVGQKDNIEWAAEIAANIRANNSLAMPNIRDNDGNALWEIESIDDTLQRAMQIIDSADYLDLTMMRGLLVPDKSILQIQKGGTTASAMVEKIINFLILSLVETAKDVSEQITKHLLRPWESLNWPNPDPDLEFELIFNNPEMLDFVARILERIVSTPEGVAVALNQINWEEIFREIGVPANTEN